MKEWKKPLVKVVIVEEDVIATSNVDATNKKTGMDSGKYVDQSQDNMWGNVNNNN